jgi:hypothetical protein
MTVLILALENGASPARPAEYAVPVREGIKDGRSLVILGNQFEELAFDPARGGRCSSFRFLDRDEQIIGMVVRKTI